MTKHESLLGLLRQADKSIIAYSDAFRIQGISVRSRLGGCWATQIDTVCIIYAARTIRQNGSGKTNAIGFLGPTYVAIRSGKQLFDNV